MTRQLHVVSGAGAEDLVDLRVARALRHVHPDYADLDLRALKAVLKDQLDELPAGALVSLSYTIAGFRAALGRARSAP